MTETQAYQAPFSVLISVYHGSSASQLQEALTSVWDSQTVKPSEIVLVEDGPVSTELSQVIQTWSDRLGSQWVSCRFFENKGLRHALNLGLKSCRYDLVARMDGDDISVPKRFELQCQFMATHPEVAVLGGAVDEYDDTLTELKHTKRMPLNHDELLEFAKYRSPLNHPTVMYRKPLILALGGYPDIFPEDYPLWIHMIQSQARLANLPDVLVKMRTDSMLSERRSGWRLFKQEVTLYRHFKDIGFLSTGEFCKNVLIRAVLRLSPSWVRQMMYLNFRG